MDVSKEYQKMCLDAQELQSTWKISNGDYIQRASFIGIFSSSNYAYSINKEHLEQKFIPTDHWNITRTELTWLPRQDQLQDMLDLRKLKFNLLYRFIKFFRSNSYYSAWFKTMEQLWLAFVMHEKYNKTWNGKEWI